MKGLLSLTEEEAAVLRSANEEGWRDYTMMRPKKYTHEEEGNLASRGYIAGYRIAAKGRTPQSLLLFNSR